MEEESKIIKMAHYDGKKVTIEEFDSSIPVPESEFGPHPPIKPFTDNDGIIGDDDRTFMNELTTYPNRTTCWIYASFGNDDHEVASGVMMGRNTVLTCAHTLYSRKLKKYANAVKVVPAAYNGFQPNPSYTPFGHSVMADHWVPDEYINCLEINAYKYDWAVIKIGDYLGDSTGFCDPSSPTEDLLNKDVISKGYPNPNGTRRIVPYLAPGKITKVNSLTFDNTIDTEEGQSGSPIFLQNKQTDIIGVLTGSFNDKEASNGVRITPALAAILIRIRIEALREE